MDCVAYGVGGFVSFVSFVKRHMQGKTRNREKWLDETDETYFLSFFSLSPSLYLIESITYAHTPAGGFVNDETLTKLTKPPAFVAELRHYRFGVVVIMTCIICGFAVSFTKCD